MTAVGDTLTAPTWPAEPTVGTVVLDRDGFAWQLMPTGDARAAGWCGVAPGPDGGQYVEWTDLLTDCGPLRVVFVTSEHLAAGDRITLPAQDHPAQPPIGTVLTDCDGDEWVRDRNGFWSCHNLRGEERMSWTRVLRFVPLTVVSLP